jgi:tetratricopeptide (TPR) repeat protein
MKHILIYILVATSLNAFSQKKNKEQLKTQDQAKELVYEGNELALNEDYVNAEMEYRKAISKQPNMAVGNYNLANSYYEKGKLEEALYRLEQAAKNATTKEEKHKAYHNIGNVLMQNKQCKEAVEAFKNALRNNPSDEETRYNFALAKECAKEQQDQEDENKDQNDQNDENKDQDEKKDDPKENEDENKEDQKDKGDQDKKEGEDEKDDKGDPKDEKEKDGNEENKDKEKPKPQPKPGQLSPQQIKNLLEAMNNQEEKVQEKINAEKTKGAKVKSEKDW